MRPRLSQTQLLPSNISKPSALQRFERSRAEARPLAHKKMIHGGSWKVPQLLSYQFKSGPVQVGYRIERWIVVLAVSIYESEKPIALNGIINLSLGNTRRAPQLTCRQ